MYASVWGPAPNTQAMYLPRARPTRPDATDDAASSTDAENAECVWEGRRTRSTRAHHGGGGRVSTSAAKSSRGGSRSEGGLVTAVDFNGILRHC